MTVDRTLQGLSFLRGFALLRDISVVVWRGAEFRVATFDMTTPTAFAAHAADLTRALSPPAAVAGARQLARHRAAACVPATTLLMSQVHKSFGAGVHGCSAVVRSLTGASLRVVEGEVVGIAGGAGSGKSTLLLCAAGLLRPEQGSVSWPAPHGGQFLAAVRPPVYLSLRDERSLPDVQRALAHGARLVILDHVSSALLRELRGVLGSFLERLATAVIVASRNTAELARVASRALELRDGHLHAVGARVELLVSQRNRSAARASSESPATLARSRIRSTYG